MRNIARLLIVLGAALPVTVVGAAGQARADLSACTAANECGLYSLTGANAYSEAQPPDGTPVHVDAYEANAFGGYITFHEYSTDPRPECAASVQRFKFSWAFEPEVTTVFGRTNSVLAMMKTQWEGDGGSTCIDENPFIWIKTGGRYGPSDSQQVNGDTFKFGFANQGGENRLYFNGGSAYFPTLSMNWPLYSTGGFSIVPEFKYYGHPMSIVYVYARVPDGTSPSASTPGAAPTVTVTAIGGRNLLNVRVEPALRDDHYLLAVQRRGSDGSWVTLTRTYWTMGTDEARVIDLPAGTYRVLVKATSGHGSSLSRPVRLVR